MNNQSTSLELFVKDFEIHFMYTLPLSKNGIDIISKLAESKSVSKKTKTPAIRSFITGRTYKTELYTKEVFTGSHQKYELKIELSIFYCVLSKIAVIEAILQPYNVQKSSNGIDLDSFIRNFTRAERSKGIGIKLSEIKAKSLFDNSTIDNSKIFLVNGEEYYQVKLWDLIYNFSCTNIKAKELIDKNKLGKETQNGFPVVIIHETKMKKNISAEQLSENYPKVILGLLTRPSYGHNALSEKRFKHDNYTLNYFYSDIIYQNFHLRAALSLVTNYNKTLTKDSCKKYHKEILNLFRLVRMLWYESHIILSNRLFNDEDALTDLESQEYLNDSIQFLFTINFQYMEKGSKVYLQMFDDAIAEFGVKKRLTEMATKIEESLQKQRDVIRSKRLRQLTLTLSFFGAIMSASKFYEWLYYKLDEMIASRIVVFVVVGVSILGIGIVALLITRFMLYITNKLEPFWKRLFYRRRKRKRN